MTGESSVHLIHPVPAIVPAASPAKSVHLMTRVTVAVVLESVCPVTSSNAAARATDPRRVSNRAPVAVHLDPTPIGKSGV